MKEGLQKKQTSNAEQVNNKERQDLERIEHVLGRLGMTLRDLEGKKTLDLGSGRGELARVAKRMNLDVVSLDLDPYLTQAADFQLKRVNSGLVEYENQNEKSQDFEKIRESIYGKTELLDTPGLVMGDARMMPFADGSFDLIISHASPPITWMENNPQRKSVLEEFRRVIKEEGEARFGPLLKGARSTFKYIDNRLEFHPIKGEEKAEYAILHKN